MKLRNVLLAATIVAAPVAVKAQPVTGLYVGAGAGYNYLQVDKFKSIFVANRTTTIGGDKLRDDGGFATNLSLGYGLGNGLRVEVEGNYRNEHTRFTTPTSKGLGGGNLLEYGPAVNVLYDFYLGGPIMPYVGVGAGYGFTQLQNTRTTGNVGIRFNNDTQGSVTGQAILGVSYTIPAFPALAFTAEYRFHVAAEDEKFKGRTALGLPATGKLDSQFNHALMFGVRFAFNAVRPPPPPAAPLVPTVQSDTTRTYLVFFDWDRADLTARARQIIAEAAQNSMKVHSTRIEVSGNADLSGTPQYNQGLSLRRAESVAAEMVRDGVPRAAIDIHAYGDSRPLVATARGVREPQNRRVEIVLR